MGGRSGTGPEQQLSEAAGTAAAAASIISGQVPPPPGVDLQCLHGVRALASLGVILLHCFFFWQVFVSYQTKYELTRSHPLIKVASAGMIWVDVLFVMSAMLAACQLIPRLEDACPSAPTCGRVVLGYWRRRALRILPAYAVANLLAAVALGPADVAQEAAVARWLHFYHCPRTLWANALFIQNFLGNQACAIHFWTVAIQVQFDVAFPLLLCMLRPRSPAFRARLAALLAAVGVAGTAWRVWAAWQTDDLMELPVADFAVDAASQRSWASMLHATYLPTASRAAQLAAGAALGLLLQSHAALRHVQRRRVLVSAVACALLAVYLHLLRSWHLLFRRPGMPAWPLRTARLHLALLSFGSPFAAVLVAAMLLALMLHAGPLGVCTRLLGAPMWRPLSNFSYTLYLVHEQARLWVALVLPPGLLPNLVATHPIGSFVCICLCTLAAGYAAALPLHFAVERRWR